MMKRIRIVLFPILTVLLALPRMSSAEEDAVPPRLTISGVRTEDYPSITVYLILHEPGSLHPLGGLSPGMFEIQVGPRRADEIVLKNQLASGEGCAFLVLLDLGSESSELNIYKDVVLSLMSGLGPSDQLAVLTFDREVTQIVGFTHDRDQLADAIQALHTIPEGPVLHDAIGLAADLVQLSLESLPHRRIALILTSRADQGSALLAEEARDRAREVELALVVTGKSPGRDAQAGAIRDKLRWLAENTGGTTAFFGKQSELVSGLESLNAFFQNQPVIEIAKAPFEADGKEHTLSVRLSTSGGAVMNDFTFVAPKGSFSRLQVVLLAALVVAAVFSLIFLFKARSPRVPLFGHLVPVMGGKKQSLRGLVKIGSDDDCQIIIRDKRISRHHACIELRDDGPWLTDMNSLNGTLVNGKSVQTHLLVEGDVVNFAKVLDFRFEPAVKESKKPKRSKKSTKGPEADLAKTAVHGAPSPGVTEDEDANKTMVQPQVVTAADDQPADAGKTMVQPGAPTRPEPEDQGRTMVKPGGGMPASAGEDKTRVSPGGEGDRPSRPPDEDAGKTVVRRPDESSPAPQDPSPPDPNKTVVRPKNPLDEEDGGRT